MVMIDFSEWDAYQDMVREIGNEYRSTQMRFLEQVGREIEANIMARASEHSDSGNWMQNFETIVDELSGEPSLRMGHFGDNSEQQRLSIYWKVLERGAVPNPIIPYGALLKWSERQTGNILIGLDIIARNRAGIFGISANPIISFSFILDDNFIPIGLTPESQEIWDRAFDRFSRRLEAIWNASANKFVKARRGARGRFVKI